MRAAGILAVLSSLMVEAAKELDGLIDDQYVPSSVERKKAVLMYFFVGIVAALSKEKVSIYEYFHLKQSLGWWMIFFISAVIGIVLLFIPYVWVIPLFVFLCFLVIRVIFLKQAREGTYTIQQNKILLPFFAGMGERVLGIFELEVVAPQHDTKEKI